jgi:hypothetical protein
VVALDWNGAVSWELRMRSEAYGDEHRYIPP